MALRGSHADIIALVRAMVPSPNPDDVRDEACRQATTEATLGCGSKGCRGVIRTILEMTHKRCAACLPAHLEAIEQARRARLKLG